MDENFRKAIRKFALDNGRKYNGSPNLGSVIGKLLAENPEAKLQLKELSKEIKQICEDVSKLSVEKQTEELKKIAPELLEEKKIVEERKLKPLPNAEKGKVVLRIAPAASGIMHIGHGVTFSLNYLYSKEYDGRLILRIEDTNPAEVYEPAYHMIEFDANWLFENSIKDIMIQSSRLESYYDYGEKLVAKGKAYVCTCSGDIFRDFSLKKLSCPCRKLSIGENRERWDKMFVEYAPGEAVVRMRTNIEDPNPAMRDWPAFRVNHHVHPKVGDKYKVWPLMNFSVAIDDHESGVTHTIRGKDHVDNAKRQQHVYDAFGWKAPVHCFTGRIKFEGIELSKRKIKAAIENGKYSDWDDIRLATLVALKRRGFQPGAFHEFAKDIGLGLNDKRVHVDDFFKSLEAHNRKILDPVASRYFFVPDPVKVEIQNAPKKTVKPHLHPDDKTRGCRTLNAKSEILVPKADLNKIKPDLLYRLMDYCNFRKEDNEFTFDSEELDKYRKEGSGTMQWLPTDENIDVQVLMPDNNYIKGKGELSLLNTKVEDIVQLERFGFCRVDKKEKNRITLWFGHK